MQALLRFLSRYGHLLVFIVLELICIRQVVRYNDNQRTTWNFNLGLWSGYVHDRVQSSRDYLRLADLADSLQSENASLRSELRNARFQTLSQPDTIIDTLRLQQYSYLPARVLSNTAHLRNNYVLIDQGIAQGVTAGMGVMAPGGVVGTVSKASEHYSLITPLHHSRSRISVMVGETGFFGSLMWSGRGLDKFKLEDVPRHADIKVGTELFTSGYSTLYPEGLRVGSITEVSDRPGENTLNISARLGLDLGRIRSVYIIQHLYRGEVDSLIIDPSDG